VTLRNSDENVTDGPFQNLIIVLAAVILLLCALFGCAGQEGRRKYEVVCDGYRLVTVWADDYEYAPRYGAGACVNFFVVVDQWGRKEKVASYCNCGEVEAKQEVR
jgi:hypothetical protein